MVVYYPKVERTVEDSFVSERDNTYYWEKLATLLHLNTK